VPVTVDPQQQRFLDLMDRASGEPVSFADLRAAGVGFPAAVAAELELLGFVVERVCRPGRDPGLRLGAPSPGLSVVPPTRRWRR
jgi:hypothetical protein